jgi:hypothetical protein
LLPVRLIARERREEKGEGRPRNTRNNAKKMSPDADIKRKSGIHLQNYAHAKLETA